MASAFLPAAVSYRAQHGLSARDGLMAVGVVRMVEARAAGIVYSRPPDRPDQDAVVVGATRGLAAGMVAGSEGGEYFEFRGGHGGTQSELLRQGELLALEAAARRLEAHFGSPQDVEWAIDRDGALYVLQCRPVTTVRGASAVAEEEGEAVIASGGRCACPGVGCGPVVPVRAEDPPAAVPAGAVLVTPHSHPSLVRVMDRCAAIVTEVGLPTGHMASLAHEYNIPTIVGMAGALSRLQPGTVVTVDATRCRVLDGSRPVPPRQPMGRPSRQPAGGGERTWLPACRRSSRPCI